MDTLEIFKLLNSINYWSKKPAFKLGYIRQKYSQALWQSVGNTSVKVIAGRRRSGKSFLLRQLMYKLINERKVNKKNIFYLNKEMFEFDTIATATDLSDLIKLYESNISPKGKVYVFIDEVQEIRNNMFK
jgi:predicted AAA+ superfamily ATPase